MKLYERIENNNFDEIDRNRAIELIKGGNGHLVYNENYFKLQKENEELKSKIGNKDKYFELITGLGYDYDGYYNRETSNGNIKGLADLIDELVQAARDGLNDIPYLLLEGKSEWK